MPQRLSCQGCDIIQIRGVCVCSHPYWAKPYQLVTLLLIKKSLDDVHVKPLYNSQYYSFLPYLLIHDLEKCVFYIIYTLKLPLCVSFKTEHLKTFALLPHNLQGDLYSEKQIVASWWKSASCMTISQALFMNFIFG